MDREVISLEIALALSSVYGLSSEEQPGTAVRSQTGWRDCYSCTGGVRKQLSGFNDSILEDTAHFTAKDVYQRLMNESGITEHVEFLKHMR